METAAVETPPVIQMPELPPALERCLKRSLRQKPPNQVGKAKRANAQDDVAKLGIKKVTEGAGKAGDVPHGKTPSADALLLAELKTKRDRELCAYQLMKWFQEQRALKVAQK